MEIPVCGAGHRRLGCLEGCLKSKSSFPPMSPPLHYAGQNLRGRNFKGQDLTGANFSNADIRGANFTRAILQLIFLILARQGFTAKTSRTMALGLAIGVFGSGLLTGSLIPGAISFLPQG